jgi:hypothetical protein
VARFSLSLLTFLENLPIPFVSINLSNILAWNYKVNEYIIVVFDFAYKFLAFDGAMLLFHLNDLKILNKVNSYLESYCFKIQL